MRLINIYYSIIYNYTKFRRSTNQIDTVLKMYLNYLHIIFVISIMIQKYLYFNFTNTIQIIRSSSLIMILNTQSLQQNRNYIL